MKAVAFLLILGGALVVSSCGGFAKRWDLALVDYRGGSLSAPAGPWEGNWHTTNNGHSGKLRAVVAPIAGEPGVYAFHYHATWGISSGTFKLERPVVATAKGLRVEGEKKIPMFGTFRHTGVITRSSFEASFSGEDGDVGGFSLRRPLAAPRPGLPR